MKIGDEVMRMLGGTIPMRLKITDIRDGKIVCGLWEFDERTGAEIDEELCWGNAGTGSYIVLTENREVENDKIE